MYCNYCGGPLFQQYIISEKMYCNTIYNSPDGIIIKFPNIIKLIPVFEAMED